MSNPHEPQNSADSNNFPGSQDPRNPGSGVPPVPPAPPQYTPQQHGRQRSGGHPPHQGQYQEPYQGSYGGPPARRSRKGLWIALGIVGGVVILAIVGVVLLVGLIGNATGKARQAADDFTGLLIEGRTGEAYDRFLDPSLMENLSREDFDSGIASLQLDDSCRTNYSSVNVSSNNGNNAADLAGNLSCTGKTIDLAYRFEGRDELKMVSIRLRPKE